MARSSSKGGLTLHVRGDREAIEGLKRARKDLDRAMRAGLKEVAEEVSAPEVRERTPRGPGARGRKHLADTVKGVGTARSAAVEIRGPHAGITEHGGTRRDRIEAAEGSALATPRGPRAAVSKPRRYTGRKMLQEGVEASVPRARPRLEEAMSAPFRRHVGGVT